MKAQPTATALRSHSIAEGIWALAGEWDRPVGRHRSLRCLWAGAVPLSKQRQEEGIPRNTARAFPLVNH